MLFDKSYYKKGSPILVFEKWAARGAKFVKFTWLCKSKDFHIFYKSAQISTSLKFAVEFTSDD